MGLGACAFQEAQSIYQLEKMNSITFLLGGYIKNLWNGPSLNLREFEFRRRQ